MYYTLETPLLLPLNDSELPLALTPLTCLLVTFPVDVLTIAHVAVIVKLYFQIVFGWEVRIL